MAETTLTGEPATALHGRTARSGQRRFARFALVLPRCLLAAAGGVAVLLAFPPVSAWPLAPVGVTAVTLAVYRQRARRAALLGFIAGLALFVPLLMWIQVMLSGLDMTGIVAWIGVAVAQSAFVALLGAGLALVSRLPGWPLWSAALWVAEEALRGRVPFGGFTWGRLAFSQGQSPFTPYASVAGAPFVTFCVALAGGLLACAVLVVWRWQASGWSPALVFGTRVAAAAIAALLVPSVAYGVPLAGDGHEVTVAAVQGNVPRTGLDALRQREAVLNNHVQATRDFAVRVQSGKAPRPDFVVWPENADDIDPYASAYAHDLIAGAANDVGAPILVGALAGSPNPDYIRNLSIVWSPTSGPGETYLKRRLVPFGEYVPFRDIMTRLVPVYNELRPRDIRAGTAPGMLTVGGVPVAVAICFDVAYDNVVREAVRAGGKLLVVQTNNASFGGTAQPEQQLAIERLRAVEHGRAVVVAATSGISAVISPDGTLVETSEPFTQQVLVQRVPARGQLTMADRLGAAPEWALAAVGCLAVGAAIASSARAGKQPRKQPGKRAESRPGTRAGTRFGRRST